MRIQATIDTEKLPLEQAKELESLIKAASFFELPAKVSTSPRGADQFNYRISIEAGEKIHTIETNDEIVSDTLWPLLRRLMIIARASGNSPQ
jgi:hypothetical protein